jgi:polyphenol oxidase
MSSLLIPSFSSKWQPSQAMKGCLEALGLPTKVRTCITTQSIGNLSLHRNDLAKEVVARRLLLSKQMGNVPIHWLSRHVHGIRVADISNHGTESLIYHTPQMIEVVEHSDAQWTNRPTQAISILTADCLPVFFSDTQATVVGVAHAGWRGLQAGVLENTIRALRSRSPYEIVAWLGPCIGASSFQVGLDVYEAFCTPYPHAAEAFMPDLHHPNKWYANLPLLATQALQRMGIKSIIHSDICTYSDSAQWFSHRYNPQTGRFASIIWIENHEPTSSHFVE